MKSMEAVIIRRYNEEEITIKTAEDELGPYFGNVKEALLKSSANHPLKTDFAEYWIRWEAR